MRTNYRLILHARMCEFVQTRIKSAVPPVEALMPQIIGDLFVDYDAEAGARLSGEMRPRRGYDELTHEHHGVNMDTIVRLRPDASRGWPTPCGASLVTDGISAPMGGSVASGVGAAVRMTVQ